MYSVQDPGSFGDGPVWFDDLNTFQAYHMFPVQFCLQPDNTFVVQSQGNFLEDPADDSNVVKLCAASGAVYLTTASKAPYNGCLTARLQIAPVPNRFRIRLARNSQYLTGGGGVAVPDHDETFIFQTPDSNLALTFENVPGRCGRVAVINDMGVALYPNQDPPSGHGSISASSTAESDTNSYVYPDGTKLNYNPVLIFVQPDSSITVQNNGNYPDSADDANTVVFCPNKPYLQMWAAENWRRMPRGCEEQTLIAEFVL
jgi:hypothetical protein